MKRCPTCGNTYTNDGLVFCLEDGARLTSLSNQSFDPEATLRISAEESLLPPTEAARPQGAQTVRQPATPHTVPPRPPQSTSERQTPSSPAATPAPQQQKSTSPVIVAGITAIVVLLLVIAGIGVALLLRDSSQSNNSSTVENNNNRAGNREETNRNSSNTANDGGTYNSANRANSNGTNRNTTSTDSSGSAEAKVVRGAPLGESDLSALSREELRRLRNAVYARHGRTFDSVELQRYFETRPWYKPRSDYNEASLTDTDLANIKLIQAVENSRPS